MRRGGGGAAITVVLAILSTLAFGAPAGAQLAGSGWAQVGANAQLTSQADVAGSQTGTPKPGWPVTGAGSNAVFDSSGNVFGVAFPSSDSGPNSASVQVMATPPGGGAPAVLATTGFDPEGESFGFSSPVAVAADGTVYAGDRNGDLAAFTTAGQPLFTYSPGGTVGRPTVGPDGTVYFGVTNDFPFPGPQSLKVVALDPSDQSVTWRYTAKGSTNISPGVSPVALDAAGNAYFTTSAALYSVSPRGKTRWTFPVNVSGPAAPIVIGSTVYFLGTAPSGSLETLYALSTSSGRPRWSSRLQAEWLAYGTALAQGAPGTLMVPGGPGLQALSTRTGRATWSFSTGAPAQGLATDANGTTYVATSSTLYAVSPGGQQLWSQSGTLFGGPAIAPDGSVYQGGSTAMSAFADP